MNNDKERAEFEAWFMAVHLLPESDFFTRGDDGRYQYVEVQRSWEALQSINASSAARIAELEAEVVRFRAVADKVDEAACRYLAYKEVFTDLSFIAAVNPSMLPNLDMAETRYANSAEILQQALCDYEAMKGGAQ